MTTVSRCVAKTSALTGGFSLCVIRFLIHTMNILTSIAKTTDGRVSKWHFCQDGDAFFALRTSPKAKVVVAKDKSDLRRIFKLYTSWGFTKVA